MFRHPRVTGFLLLPDHLLLAVSGVRVLRWSPWVLGSMEAVPLQVPFIFTMALTFAFLASRLIPQPVGFVHATAAVVPERCGVVTQLQRSVST